MNIQVFWDVMLCCWMSGSWYSKWRGSSSPRKMYLSWCLNLEHEDTLFLWNVGNNLVSDTRSRPRRPDRSATLLWEPQLLQKGLLAHCHRSHWQKLGSSKVRLWVQAWHSLYLVRVKELLLEDLPTSWMDRLFGSVSQNDVFSSVVWTAIRLSCFASANTNVFFPNVTHQSRKCFSVRSVVTEKYVLVHILPHLLSYIHGHIWCAYHTFLWIHICMLCLSQQHVSHGVLT